MDGFVSRQQFSVETQNRILVIWLIRRALPWARMEDLELRAAFHFGNVSSVICSASWASRAARELYTTLKASALELVLVSHSVLSFICRNASHITDALLVISLI